MEKRGLYLLFIIILSLILIPIINAQPPFQQQEINFVNGYEIKVPAFATLEQNQSFNFSFHVYNISNGVPIDNSSTQCNFHLYNNKGEHLVEGNNFPHTSEHGTSNEWEITVLGGNFSRLGSYSYLISCNSTTLGGFENINFEVTPTGFTLETSNSILYAILTIGSLLLFLFILWGGIVLPFKNKRNDEGTIVSVQKLKYFKVGILFLSYVFFVWTLNLLLTLSTNFSILTQYTKFFEVIFSVVNSMSYPLFVFMLILMSIMAWKDLQLRELLERGTSKR